MHVPAAFASPIYARPSPLPFLSQNTFGYSLSCPSKILYGIYDYLSATADAAPRPEATGQDSGTHSAKVQAEPEPEGQAQADSSSNVESNIDQPGEVPSQASPSTDSRTAGDSGRHDAGTAGVRSISTTTLLALRMGAIQLSLGIHALGLSPRACWLG